MDARHKLGIEAKHRSLQRMASWPLMTSRRLLSLFLMRGAASVLDCLNPNLDGGRQRSRIVLATNERWRGFAKHLRASHPAGQSCFRVEPRWSDNQDFHLLFWSRAHSGTGHLGNAVAGLFCCRNGDPTKSNGQTRAEPPNVLTPVVLNGLR